jgi:hypothetical protein
MMFENLHVFVSNSTAQSAVLYERNIAGLSLRVTPRRRRSSYWKKPVDVIANRRWSFRR